MTYRSLSSMFTLSVSPSFQPQTQDSQTTSQLRGFDRLQSTANLTPEEIENMRLSFRASRNIQSSGDALLEDEGKPPHIPFPTLSPLISHKSHLHSPFSTISPSQKPNTPEP